MSCYLFFLKNNVYYFLKGKIAMITNYLKAPKVSTYSPIIYKQLLLLLLIEFNITFLCI